MFSIPGLSHIKQCKIWHEIQYVLKKLLHPITAIQEAAMAVEVDCHLGLHQISMLPGKITCSFFFSLNEFV